MPDNFDKLLPLTLADMQPREQGQFWQWCKSQQIPPDAAAVLRWRNKKVGEIERACTYLWQSGWDGE